MVLLLVKSPTKFYTSLIISMKRLLHINFTIIGAGYSLYHMNLACKPYHIEELLHIVVKTKFADKFADHCIFIKAISFLWSPEEVLIQLSFCLAFSLEVLKCCY